MKGDRKMVVDKKNHNKELAHELRERMYFNRITVTRLAEEIGKGRVTISLWLSKKTNQERYDVMNAAISRIISKGENKND